jgi:hypothetical protein
MSLAELDLGGALVGAELDIEVTVVEGTPPIESEVRL